MRGDIVGILSTRSSQPLPHDTYFVHCLFCAERIYGTDAIQCLRITEGDVEVSLREGAKTELYRLRRLCEEIDGILLYKHQYCECKCDPEDARRSRPLCPGKSHRDHARDAVQCIVEEMEARGEPVTVWAISRAYNNLLAAGDVNEFVQTYLEELYPDRYPPARGEEEVVWVEGGIAWANSDFLCQYDKWKYHVAGGEARMLLVPKGESEVIKRWLRRTGPFIAPFPDRHP